MLVHTKFYGIAIDIYKQEMFPSFILEEGIY